MDGWAMCRRGRRCLVSAVHPASGQLPRFARAACRVKGPRSRLAVKLPSSHAICRKAYSITGPELHPLVRSVCVVLVADLRSRPDDPAWRSGALQRSCREIEPACPRPGCRLEVSIFRSRRARIRPRQPSRQPLQTAVRQTAQPTRWCTPSMRGLLKHRRC